MNDVTRIVRIICPRVFRFVDKLSVIPIKKDRTRRGWAEIIQFFGRTRRFGEECAY